MSKDAGMLSAAVGAAGYAWYFQQSPPNRYYQCVTQGLVTTCSKMTDGSGSVSDPSLIVEVPATIPVSLDQTYVQYHIRAMSKVVFTEAEEPSKSP